MKPIRLNIVNYILFFGYMFLCCVPIKTEIKGTQNIGKIQFNNKIDSLLQLFIRSEKSAEYIYEIYIDKKDKNECEIVLKSEPIYQDYLIYNHPVNYTLVDNKIIYVYSGIEDYVNKSLYQTKLDCKSLKKKGSTLAWTYTIQRDTAYISKNIGNPFYGGQVGPTIYYKAPLK